MSKSLRMSEEQYREQAARRTRWQTGTGTTSAVVDTDQRPVANRDGGSGTPLPAAAAGHPTLPQWPAAKGGRQLTLVLPMPPSVNVLYGTGASGQKFLQPKQRDYRHDVAMIVMTVRHGEPPLAGRIEVAVTLYDRGTRAWDIDNRLKALLDALAHGGAYLNDNQLDILHVQRVRRDGDDECAVILREISA